MCVPDVARSLKLSQGVFHTGPFAKALPDQIQPIGIWGSGVHDPEQNAVHEVDIDIKNVINGAVGDPAPCLDPPEQILGNGGGACLEFVEDP